MEDFKEVILQFHSWYFWLNFGLAMIILIIFVVFLCKHLGSKFIKLFYAINVPIIALAALFKLDLLLIVALILFITGSTAFIYGNIVQFRANIINLFDRQISKSSLNRNKRKFRKIYDEEAVYHELEIAVDFLSKTKTGALITLERGTLLDDIITNGTQIDAPVKAQLLMTIFHKGTALHDGAVVIRDNVIIAASVYFKPSTKPLSGKVGSRHRAALGISETTDSVTIVVSEETGRISIAYKGVLQPISRDNFYRALVEYMQIETAELNNE